MKTLEELKKDYENSILEREFSLEIKAVLPELKALSYISDGKKRVVFTVMNLKGFKDVLRCFVPTNKETPIGTAGGEPKIVKSSFRMDLDNPPVISDYSRFNLKISYFSESTEVQVVLPTELINDFVSRTVRKISSSEYHYFTGTSENKLNRLEVSSYSWNVGNQISWYGGDKTLICEDGINEVIKYLKK